MLKLKQDINSIKTENYIWVTALIILCLSFSPLIFNFIWGNHDWLPLIQDNRLTSGLIEGRFSQYILLNLLLMGKILPILNIIIGFFFYSISLYCLSRYYFKYQTTNLSTTIYICTAASLPYITEILYFHFITLSLLSWTFIITLSLIATQKATEKNFILWEIFGFILLYIALGGYPGCINMYVTAVCCRLIQLRINQQLSISQLGKYILAHAINLILALGLLKITFDYLQQNHFMMNMYNSQAATFLELIQKTPAIIQASLFAFTETQPFLSFSIKGTIATIFIIFLFSVFIQTFKTRKNKVDILLILILILGLLISLKFSAWLISNNADNAFTKLDPATSMVRTDFYSYPILILFCLYFMHEQKKQILKNISFICAISLLITNINTNLNFSKTHLLGFTAENKLLERIINRLENHHHYQTNNLYTVVQAGEIPLRTKYYQKKAHEKYGYYTLNTPYSRHWIAFEYYNFYAPQDFVQEGTSIRQEDLTPKMIAFLSTQMTSWPHPYSVYVDDNYAIIALTPEGKELLRNQFNLLHLSHQ